MQRALMLAAAVALPRPRPVMAGELAAELLPPAIASDAAQEQAVQRRAPMMGVEFSRARRLVTIR
jgi:hypothetical protein